MVCFIGKEKTGSRHSGVQMEQPCACLCTELLQVCSYVVDSSQKGWINRIKLSLTLCNEYVDGLI